MAPNDIGIDDLLGASRPSARNPPAFVTVKRAELLSDSVCAFQSHCGSRLFGKRIAIRHLADRGYSWISDALVPRYEVRPCMLALYFLGETSKVFRLVKTSKVFARKHRRCFR